MGFFTFLAWMTLHAYTLLLYIINFVKFILKYWMMLTYPFFDVLINFTVLLRGIIQQS